MGFCMRQISPSRKFNVAYGAVIVSRGIKKPYGGVRNGGIEGGLVKFPIVFLIRNYIVEFSKKKSFVVSTIDSKSNANRLFKDKIPIELS